MDLFMRQNLLLMVRALYLCMEEKWAELGKRFDMSPSQQHILYLLSTNGQSLTPTRISELGCWHQSTVTRLLKPLKEKGLITIETNPNQARFKMVKMTDQAFQLFHDLVEAVKVEVDFPIKSKTLSVEELQMFLQVGQKIIDSHKGSAYRRDVLEAHARGINYS